MSRLNPYAAWHHDRMRALFAGTISALQFGGRCMYSKDSNRRDRLELAGRLREIREDLCGQHGAHLLADALDIRVETWFTYECGVSVPAWIALKLIDRARVNPHWLLTGKGSRCDHGSSNLMRGGAAF
jgi:hypothetical protein